MSLSKVYIFSILLEPILLLKLGFQDDTGVGLNAGRVLQLIVMIALTIRFLARPFDFLNRVKISNELSLYNKFLIFAAITGMVGALRGSYAYVGGVQINTYFSYLNHPNFRVILEYFIFAYQYFYFVILAPYFINTRKNFKFFFKWSLIFIATHLLLGWLDLALVVFFQYDFLPRHLVDGVHVGERFHGIAGEPRDAVVYTVWALWIVTVNAVWERKNSNPGFYFVGLIILTILACLSVSGFLGSAIAATLILVWSRRCLTLKDYIYIYIGVFVAAVSSLYIFHAFERLSNYVEAFSLYWNFSESLPYEVYAQYVNIYPIIRLINHLYFHEFYAFFFGAGLGSSGYVNSETGLYITFNNPHSQLIRALYDFGLLGTLFYITVHARLIYKLSSFVEYKSHRKIFLITLVLFGFFLAHRSVLMMISIGVLYALFKYNKTKPVGL